MPNNRNRNRNRNRNKRNRNQNQNQQQQQQQEQEQPEQREEEEEQQQDTQTEAVPEEASSSSSIADNGNSGSVSNGSETGPTSSKSNGNNVSVDPELGAGEESPKAAAVAAAVDTAKESTITAAKDEAEEASDPPTTNNQTEMGAKNSKQQAEKSGKRSINEEEKHKKEVEQQEVPAPLKAPGSPRQAKVIVHRIVREEDATDAGQQANKETLSPEQRLSSQELKEVAIVPEIPNVVQRNKQDVPAPQGPPLQRSTKVIIHQIRVEREESADYHARKGKPTIEEISTTSPAHPASGTLSPPPRYLVESPKNVSGAGVGGHFTHFARDMQIQELELTSDCSSGEFNVLQSPLVCEVDSETEAAPPDLQPSSRAEQQEQLRQKRAQKRNALETHFLPQLMNPRYLDSILEENSDLAGVGTAGLTRSSSSGADQAGMRVPKVTETFPKSQLDFSRRHKRREEPVALMLETKLIEEASDLESCTRLQSALSPQSEDAELVYLSSSASSSISDLMELELEQAAALAERALVDLDTDASKLFRRPDDEMSSTTTTDAATSSNETETEGELETETETERDTESRESTPVNQIGNVGAGASASSSLSSLLSAATPTPTPTPTAEQQPPRAEDTFVSFGSIREQPIEQTKQPEASVGSIGAASALSATREEFVRNMDKVRELIEMTRREEEQGEPQETIGIGNGVPAPTAPEQDQPRSPSPPPIPPPPVGLQYYNPTNPIPDHPHPVSVSMSTGLAPLVLSRQESAESHCSDSTQHSQCTAINLASPPPSFARSSPPPQIPPQTQQQTQQQPPTPPLRQQQLHAPVYPAPISAPASTCTNPAPSPAKLQQQESVISVADDEPKPEPIPETESETDPIKKLRLLCTETLASMPYGEQVLEELASVAQDIAEPGTHQQQQPAAATMPYPLPQMPHIRELQLSTTHENKSSSSSSTTAWLGMPTQADPKLLVCLSPAQRPLVGETKPDQLLDDHQKFVERRGYHELSSAQVRALDSEQEQQQQQQQKQQSEMLKTAAMMRELRKSLTPTQEPPPVPVKSAETAAKASAKRDDASDPKMNGGAPAAPAAASSSFENKPRRAADPSEHTEQQQQKQQQQHHQHQQTRSSHQMNSSTDVRFPATSIGGMESELARMFPSMAQQQHSGDIFEEQRKRFSNIETSNSQPRVQQNTKRYSNIETSSYESKKRTENGQVIYDITNSSHEKQSDRFPAAEAAAQADSPDHAPPPPIPPPPIMSATKLNGSTTANTFIEDDDATKNSRQEPESREPHHGNGESKSQSGTASTSTFGGTYEEFRQRAKAAVDAIGAPRPPPPSNGLDNEKVFKDFDRLSQQMNAELQSTRERREKSASLFDLSGMTRNQGKHPLEELKQRRHAHMQELEREIERSSRSRQERMSSVPRNMESTPTPRTHEIPIELEQPEQRSRRAESMCNLNEPRPRPHTSVGHYSYSNNNSNSASQDDWAQYASDLGYSENIARPFAREVEICYQRQNPRQSQPIRAPRLSASTNDLSSSSNSGYHQHSYDSFNAYGGRRTHAPMLSQAPQQQRPHYASCYSMIERDPNPKYISTTSRRGVSPAPVPVSPATVVPPPAYDRQQRRSSLPRELHEQQLKYILSKEEELRLEVERLQLERRRLMEEMQRAPVLPPPQRRESYRPAAKLPTLSEDEVFRQQMAEEWMNKVAEREERRQHKIIKISKIEDEQDHAIERANISDEFLSAVKERRHKLAMPADSDWESGAESQPQAPVGVAAATASESDAEAAPVRILEGQAEASLRQLPRHLREFAKFSTSEQLPDGAQVERHEQQERREEATDNSHSSASQKTSIVKTYKVSRLPPSVQDRNDATESESESTCNKYSIHESSSSTGFDRSPPTPLPSMFNGDLKELFAGSPFRSKILEEFDKYWRNFESHSASSSF